VAQLRRKGRGQERCYRRAGYQPYEIVLTKWGESGPSASHTQLASFVSTCPAATEARHCCRGPNNNAGALLGFLKSLQEAKPTGASRLGEAQPLARFRCGR
jgi:hypothetical protein